MKKMWLSALILASVTSVAGTAQARGGGGGGSSGFLFDINLYYDTFKDETQNTGGTATTNNNTTEAVGDIKLGYLSSSGLYFGGIYTSRSNSFLNQSGTNGSSEGASIGYMASSGLFIMGHYLASSSYGTYSSGTGYQADIGYKAGMGNGVLLGAEITYRTATYKKDSSNSSLDHYTVTETMPMISIGFLF